MKKVRKLTTSYENKMPGKNVKTLVFMVFRLIIVEKVTVNVYFYLNQPFNPVRSSRESDSRPDFVVFRPPN